MDKEQAIEKLNDIRCHVKETSAEEQALVMAIDALKAQLSQEGTTKDTTADLIDRQQAIDVIEDYPHGNVWNVESVEEMVDKIKALTFAQSVATETNVGDKISRQEAINALKEHRALYCDNTPDTFSKLPYGEKCRVDELDTAISTLVNLPSTQPAEKTGHWILKYDDMDRAYAECSVCGMMNYAGKINYCPNCGAHMIEKKVTE